MNGIGDAFLALAAIRNMRSEIGSSSMFVLTTPEIKSTVYAEMGDQVFAADRFGSKILKQNSSQIDKLASALRRWPHVNWYSLNSYFPPPAQEELAISKIRPTVIGRLSDIIFNPTTKQLIGISMQEAFFRVLGTSESQPRVWRAPLISPEDRCFAKSFIARRLANDGLIPLALHSDTSEEKTWRDENWIKLSRLLRSKKIVSIMLGKPPPPIVRSREIISLHKLSWHQQVAILSQSKLFVGVDSCFAHIADGLELPGLVLFGPSSEVVWGPRGPTIKPLFAPNRLLANLRIDVVAERVLNYLE